MSVCFFSVFVWVHSKRSLTKSIPYQIRSTVAITLNYFVRIDKAKAAATKYEISSTHVSSKKTQMKILHWKIVLVNRVAGKQMNECHPLITFCSFIFNFNNNLFFYGHHRWLRACATFFFASLDQCVRSFIRHTIVIKMNSKFEQFFRLFFVIWNRTQRKTMWNWFSSISRKLKLCKSTETTVDSKFNSITWTAMLDGRLSRRMQANLFFSLKIQMIFNRSLIFQWSFGFSNKFAVNQFVLSESLFSICARW